MSPDTLTTLDRMRRDKRTQTATFALRCFGAPAAFLTVLWWVTR